MKKEISEGRRGKWIGDGLKGVEDGGCKQKDVDFLPVGQIICSTPYLLP